MRNTWPLLLSLPLALSPPDARAETAEERGLAIAEEADRRDSGWGDSQAALRMILRNRHGQESGRQLDVRFLEVPEDGDKTFGYFQASRTDSRTHG